ncbi:MAG: hypothetical protein K5945_01455, partial [Bacteroidaceae bacterium]|nr:hypothetical protein [Bacteroidaceae bacterium]
VFYLSNEPKKLPNELYNLPNGPCNLPKHVKIRFSITNMPLCDSKQRLPRQQADGFAAASRRHCGSKQETNAATLSVCHILHFAFDLRSSLLPLGIAQM